MRYPGGKAGSGVYQRIINQMPPHEVYVEPFMGGAAVMGMKRPARWNYGVDIDPRVVAMVSARTGCDGWVPARAMKSAALGDGPFFKFSQGDAVRWLRKWKGRDSTLVYCDPPYLMSTRSSQRRIYRHELELPGHIALLDVAVRLPCMVMISGYPSKLYDDRLSSWRVVRYRTMTRGGRMADECLWCNFPEPTALHDYRYLGRDFRERERITRKRARWLTRLAKLPVLERAALDSALVAVPALGASGPLPEGEV